MERNTVNNKIEKEVLSSLPRVDGARELVLRAIESGQEHLFEGWKAKSEAFRETLVSELARIDWEVLAEAIDKLKGGDKVEGMEAAEIVPKAMRTMEEQERFRQDEWELGRQALIDGEVAWIVPAGGSGSRLVRLLEEIYASLPFKRRYKVADQEMRHFDEACAKGQLPITPVLGKSFYALFIEQALALGARMTRMPVLILMLSDETREASMHAITNHPHYKALEGAIVLFDHGMNPVLDDSGRMIQKDKEGRLVFSGNGNGGMFKAMQNGEYRGADCIISYLKESGVKTVSFSNVDNPVSDIILPRMLGSHFRLDAKLTFGVCKKVDPYERVGMIVGFADQPNLDKIEYNEFPPELAIAKNPEDPGRLLYEHGDVNVFLMDLGEMAGVRHLQLKCYGNKLVKTEWGRRQGNKFESFAFHIIQQVPGEKVDVKEILRSEQFMPTKNSIGRDSPATVIRALCTRNMQWLEALGAEVAHQDLEGCLEDFSILIEESILPAARGTSLEPEVRETAKSVDSALLSHSKEAAGQVFEKLCLLSVKAREEGLDKLKFACDHAYSILMPGEANAFVEFSPALALEAEDLAEIYFGEGWVLEEGCQVALTGHPTQVILGEDFHVGKNSVFILDIKNEYGGITMSDDRWLYLDLDNAGSAEIGDKVTVAESAEVEIHVHGSGRVVIPEGTVFEGEHFIEVKDGETVTLG